MSRVMKRKQPHIIPVSSRREFLERAGAGFGAIPLSYLLQQDGFFLDAAPGGERVLNPLAPKPPHHPPRAKSVIWLFMEGGPSHLDLFDPKPALQKLAGQPLPPSFGRPITATGTANNDLTPSQRSWKHYRNSGI